MLKGIDVSKYQGTIQWDKVKLNIDFAILRCGFGNDIEKQDDICFLRNVAECERLNIPFAIYLYSYATTEEMIDSEIAHTLRLIGSHKPFCVYFDMEDNSTTNLGKAKLTEFAKRFCEGIKLKGFKVGVYANENWFKNYIDVAELHKLGYSIWCAKYSNAKPNIVAPFDIWQYTSKGSVDGINGNVDMNRMYNDIRNNTQSVKKSNEEIAEEVIKGLWDNGEARKTKLLNAGYDYSEIQAKVNEKLKNITEPTSNCFPKYKGNSASLVDALKSLGINSALSYRGQIAQVNGIVRNSKLYIGLKSHNEKMFDLLKQGNLIKP